jgi:hypothetical protein
MIGVGKRSDDPALEELLLVADRCGKDPVHLAVEKLEEERVRPISYFSNTGHTSGPRRLISDMMSTDSTGLRAAARPSPGTTASTTPLPSAGDGSPRILLSREWEDRLDLGMAAQTVEALAREATTATAPRW